jgi:hypothetical protein
MLQKRVETRQGRILSSKKHCSSALIQELIKKIPEGNGRHRIYVKPHTDKRKQLIDSMLLVRAVLYYPILKDSTQMHVYKATK